MWFVCQNPSKLRKFQPLPGQWSGSAGGLVAIFIMHCWFEDLPTPSIDIPWLAGFLDKISIRLFCTSCLLEISAMISLSFAWPRLSKQQLPDLLLSSPRLEPNPVKTVGRQRWRWRGLHGVRGDATFQWNPSWHQKLQLAHTSTAGTGQADPPQDSKNNSKHFKTKKTPISVSLAIKDARLHKTAAGGEGGSRVFPLLLTLAKEC